MFLNSRRRARARGVLLVAHMRLVPTLTFAWIFASRAVASADVERCSGVDADVTFTATDLTQHSGDTGWLPAGEAAQLRLTGLVTGKTTVAMGLHPTACWTDAEKTGKLSLTSPGRPQAGLLDSEYGAEIQLTGQIHTSILGESIDWEGPIKIPFIPNDLLLAGTATFDPTLLPGAAQTSVSVSDTTSPVVVLSTNLLAEIIAVTGISGGLNINVVGAMTTVYSTSSISYAGSPLTRDGGTLSVPAPDNGFGPSLQLPIAATGVVHYEPSLTFSLAFFVKILGIYVINTNLASVTMPLSPIDRSIQLTGGNVTVPLPHLGEIPLTLGFASSATQQLQIHNSGLAPLMIEVQSAPDGITAQPITVAPGADGAISVTAADATMVSGALVLATNDPNFGQLSIALDPATTGQTNAPDPTADGDGPSSEHAGCSTGGGSSGTLPVLLVLGLVLSSRGRRKS